MLELNFELRGKSFSTECEAEDLENELEEFIKNNFSKELNEAYPLDFLVDIEDEVSEYNFKWDGYDVDLRLSKVVDFANEVVDIKSIEDMADALDERLEEIDNYYDFSDPNEFFNIYFEDKPYEAARAVHFGEINWNADFIKFNGYGNLETCDKIPYEDYSDEIINRFIVERI